MPCRLGRSSRPKSPGRRTHSSKLQQRRAAAGWDRRTDGRARQWRRQDFVNRGESEVWVYRGSRVQSPPVPVVLSAYQRGSLLDGLAVYLSCYTKKFHDNESTHILHNFGRPPIGGSFPPSPLAAPLALGCTDAQTLCAYCVNKQCAIRTVWALKRGG